MEVPTFAFQLPTSNFQLPTSALRVPTSDLVTGKTMIFPFPTTAHDLPPEFHSDLRAAFGDVGPRMIQALRIVWPRLEEGVRIDDVARQMRVHRSTLLRWFQLDLGMSPQYAIMRLRLARAVRLVATTQAPLTDVAVQAGYCSFQSMARYFREVLRSTPSKVRRNQGVRNQTCAAPDIDRKLVGLPQQLISNASTTLAAMHHPVT